MKKIIVIGCPGSGKSTFSRALRDKTKLPLYYLDMIWHKPDKTNVTREEFDSRLHEILKNEEWIIDGNYNRTMEMRLKECDTVFLFDLPTEVCLNGASSRVGTKREEMPWVEEEFDPEFKEYIISFPESKLPEIYSLLEKYSDKNIFIFRSHKDVSGFLETI
ncbi:MAG: AAA family ATPase [Clostridia bacterium]|nr:AAA family ATPase [Clostridia bacterium]